MDPCESRASELDAIFRRLADHIASDGEWLEGRVRLLLALEGVRASAGGCEECNRLTQVCLRPGQEDSFWNLFSVSAHTGATKLESLQDKELERAAQLIPFAHMIGAHQQRMSHAWWKDQLDVLSKIAPDICGRDDCATELLVEMACVVSFAITIHRYYKIVGQSEKTEILLRERKSQTSLSGPSRRLMPKMVPEQKFMGTWGPVLDSDKAELTEEERTAVGFTVMGPFAVTSIVPKEAVIRREVQEALYTNAVMTVDHPLPANRCLSRQQMEAVASATAAGLHCSF